MSSYKTRGSSGKVNLALSSLPVFQCLPNPGNHLQRAISISPSIDYLERAYDEAKYGHYSSKPYLDIPIPSTLDPEIAPLGKHVMSIFVQYVPYDLKGGWDAISRNNFGDTVISTIEQYVPDIRNILLHEQIFTSFRYRTQIRYNTRNIFHGELSPQQLFSMRPALGYGNYRTPHSRIIHVWFRVPPRRWCFWISWSQCCMRNTNICIKHAKI
jgi:phytoene dehydrogenase-like protein